MGVMRGRRGEALDVRGQEVGVGAAGAPRGEAGGDAGVILQIQDGHTKRVRIRAVGQDARVGRLEFVFDSLTAAWHVMGRGGTGDA